MHLNADISSALQLLENIKQIVDDTDDAKLQANTAQDIKILISVLENPIFRSIVTVQDSLSELNQQLGQHPSILPSDFDINISGELIINVPPGSELFDPDFETGYQNTQEFDEQRVPSAQLSPGSPQTLGFSIVGKTSDICNLSEGDKILAIDGNLLESNISHQQALSILQKARGLVELVVARTAPDEEDTVHRSPSAVSDTSKAGSDMMLNYEWAQVEAIDLVNDGTGLGFGIIGGRVMGVVVKTILPGGVADRDGRLQSGDHILQIGEVNLLEMGSEQVATVLRQSGTHVRLVVARPADPTSLEFKQLNSTAPLIPTRLLNEPNELDKYLLQHGYPQVFNQQHNNKFSEQTLFDKSSRSLSLSRMSASPSLPLLNLDLDISMPEMEKFTVELKKDSNGLGITIAGYVCEKEELSGIFVKSINKGSAADINGKIHVNDRIVEVDGQSLQGYTNHQAVEVLRNSGNSVTLCLERYLRGPKYEQLQQAIAANEMKPSSSFSPSTQVSRYSLPENDDFLLNNQTDEVLVEAENKNTGLIITASTIAELPPISEEVLRIEWSKIMGPDTQIVIAQLEKFGESGGLGISLEGTVDVEDGKEVRPHHYIRSILAEGPVGKNGTLKSGDELLEVNGYKLLGMNHLEVVSILKELPKQVRMVCGRNVANTLSYKSANSDQDNLFSPRGMLGGSLQNLLPSTDRLVKAKSDGSLATSMAANGAENSFNKIKSRSLEPLTGLAMWSSEPQIIELVKGERGLGFSILDYQDPIDPNDTVIVIRSLVPGGVAQLDGRLIPGDRLLFVNDKNLENASLDQAVQALKGAAKGIVRIGVAKPLPIPDTVTHNSQQLSEHARALTHSSLNSTIVE